MGAYYSGRVSAILFEDRAKGFFIMKMALDDGEKEKQFNDFFGTPDKMFRKPTSVVGTVPGMDVEVGTWFGFEANWVKNPKYGDQLKITKAPIIKDGWDAQSALSTLASHGVSEVLCDEIMKMYGDKTVKVLDSGDVSLLRKIPGLSSSAAQAIFQEWGKVKVYFEALGFLADAGVPKAKVGEIWGRFKEDTEQVLTANPWRLVEVPGILFSQADEVALRIGVDMNSPLRVRGAVLYASKTRKGMGHTYLSTGDVVHEVKAVIPTATETEIGESLKHLLKERLLVMDRETIPGTTAIYDPWWYEMEKGSAQLLADRMVKANAELHPQPENLREELEDKTATPYPTRLASVSEETLQMLSEGKPLEDIASKVLDRWSDSAHLQLSKAQRQGVLNALTQPVSILTGLPGTGKSTAIKAIVSILRDAGVTFLLCAPTGIAAKRMATVAKSEAFTIHRALGAKARRESSDEREASYAGITGSSSGSAGEESEKSDWGHSPSNPHAAEVIIVDETSMVDQHLLHRLLSSTRNTSRIVFVGDAAQLPSVGPGNVLRDMIRSEKIATVNLTEIFRQSEQSGIVAAAHSVFHGNTPATSTEGDFILLPVIGDSKIQDTIVRLASRLYHDRKNFQVLSPRHSGDLGVTALNSRLREVLNPKSPGLQEMKLGRETIREDDRVMVVKNDYKHDIYNGDVGKVASLDRRDRKVTIKLHGPPVVQVQIPFSKAPTYLRLAYAMTIHKSQGMEYDYIIMPVDRSFGHQLQRNLFYTAITRAKTKVILVGQHDAIQRSVANSREDARNTLLEQRLRQLVQDL